MVMRWTILFMLVALASGGCSSTGRTPKLGTEKSFDGLTKVENARFGAAWVRRDFDLSGYTHVKLQGAGIAYKPVRRTGGSGARRSTGSEFPISDAAKERLESIMEKAFQSELANSKRFELTEETGPDVLLVWGGLLDVVSFVPPDVVGRGNVFINAVGEATLLIELRDSQSNTTLARLLDRRAAQSVQGGQVSNAVTNTSEIRRMANRWARLLRERIDHAPTLHDGLVVEPAP
jgi:hypothetical protein